MGGVTPTLAYVEMNEYLVSVGQVVANATVLERTAAGVLSQCLDIDPLLAEIVAGQMQLAGTLQCIRKIIDSCEQTEDVTKVRAWLVTAEQARAARNNVIHQAAFLDDADRVTGFVRRGDVSTLTAQDLGDAVNLTLEAVASGADLLGGHHAWTIVHVVEGG